MDRGKVDFFFTLFEIFYETSAVWKAFHEENGRNFFAVTVKLLCRCQIHSVAWRTVNSLV